MNKKVKPKRYNRIKAELIDAGKTNADLAKYMGVHISTVSDWCTNTNQPPIQDFFRIAEFLGIEVQKLLFTKSEKPGQPTQDVEDATLSIKKSKKKTRNPK